MKNKKGGDLNQWKEVGTLSKEVYNKLVDLCIIADKKIPRKDWRQALRAQDAMLRFKNDAENRMFSQLGELDGASIDVFFGDTFRSYGIK